MAKDSKIMTRLDRATYKKLQQMKLDLDKSSVSEVISMLVDMYEEKKK